MFDVWCVSLVLQFGCCAAQSDLWGDMFSKRDNCFHSSFTPLLALPVEKLSDYDKHQLPQVQSLLFLQKEFFFLIGGKWSSQWPVLSNDKAHYRRSNKFNVSFTEKRDSYQIYPWNNNAEQTRDRTRI